MTRFDINLGAGVTRVHLLDSDEIDLRDDDMDDGTFSAEDDAIPDFPDPIEFSVSKHQLGLSAAVVYQYSEQVHFAIDYFRAQFEWYQGEEQAVNFVNTGMTVQW